MPKFLIKQRRVWYATLEIPKNLRPVFGKARFKETLKTESLTVAEQRVLRVIADWKQLIAQARLNDGSFDAQLATWRAKEAELKRKGVPAYDIDETLFDIATSLHSDHEEGVQLYMTTLGRSILLREHINSYLATLSDAPKSIDMKRHDLKKFTNKFKHAEDVTKKALIDWVENTLMATEKLSNSTCKRMISACKGYWEYLERHKDLEISAPFSGVVPANRKTKQSQQETRKAFTPYDYKKLIENVPDKDPKLAALIRLGAYTGCRIEELCSLKINKVDDKAFMIEDAKTKAGWRTVPIHDHIKPLVTKLKQESDDTYLLSGLTFNKYDDRSNAIGKRFGRLKSKLGYGGDLVFHSLRKGVATQLEAAQIPENIAARILGHEFKTMSYGLYSDGSIPFKVLYDALSKVDWGKP